MLQSDRQIRRHLHQRLEAANSRRSRLIDEFWIPVSHERADIARINGHLSAYEIKSSRDTLRRLDRQVAAFSNIFDYVTLVVAETHLGDALARVPSWWGIIEVPGRRDAGFRAIRRPAWNASVDAGALLRLLWRAELEALTSGWLHLGSASRQAMRTEVLRVMPTEDIRSAVRRALLRRDLGTRRWREAA
jgi:hypothetical protein